MMLDSIKVSLQIGGVRKKLQKENSSRIFGKHGQHNWVRNEKLIDINSKNEGNKLISVKQLDECTLVLLLTDPVNFFTGS